MRFINKFYEKKPTMTISGILNGYFSVKMSVKQNTPHGYASMPWDVFFVYNLKV